MNKYTNNDIAKWAQREVQIKHYKSLEKKWIAPGGAWVRKKDFWRRYHGDLGVGARI